jgi:hypothetical protein
LGGGPKVSFRRGAERLKRTIEGLGELIINHTTCCVSGIDSAFTILHPVEIGTGVP